MAKTALLEVRDWMAYVTMNRTEKLNAINNEMLGDLFEAFTEAKENPDIWVAILTGARWAFGTGHDLPCRPRALDMDGSSDGEITGLE